MGCDIPKGGDSAKVLYSNQVYMCRPTQWQPSMQLPGHAYATACPQSIFRFSLLYSTCYWSSSARLKLAQRSPILVLTVL
jgi:hypothetical protein